MTRRRAGTLFFVIAVFCQIDACTSNRPHPVAISNSCKPRIIRLDRVQSSGFADVTPTTRAVFALAVRDSSMRGYVAFARGQKYWFDGRVSTGGPGQTNPSGKREDSWVAGSSSYTVVYDSATNSADVLGKRIALDTANVLLIDRVDGVGGLPSLVTALCPPEVRMDQVPEAIVETMSYVRAFVGGAPVPNTR